VQTPLTQVSPLGHWASVVQPDEVLHWEAEQVDPEGQTSPQPPQFAGSDVVSTHVPAQQASPLAQLDPAPQLAGAVQVPATQTSPLGHWASSVQPDAVLHTPAEQVDPVGHAVAHDPQFAASVWRSTHVSVQQISPAAQPAPPPQLAGAVQTPETQTSPLPQSASVVQPDVVTHTPEEQVPPEAQAVPHAPQLAVSLWRSAHASPQQVSPLAQLVPPQVAAVVQAPSTQASPLGHWASVVQAAPPPLLVFVQAPSEATVISAPNESTA
jgi:hypothetical protein